MAVAAAKVDFSTSRSDISETRAEFNFSVTGVSKPEGENHRQDITKPNNNCTVNNIVVSSDGKRREGTYDYVTIEYGDLWYSCTFRLGSRNVYSKDYSSNKGTYTYTGLTNGTEYSSGVTVEVTSQQTTRNWRVKVYQQRSSTSTSWPTYWNLTTDTDLIGNPIYAEIIVAEGGASKTFYTKPSPFNWTNRPRSGYVFDMKASDMNDIITRARKRSYWYQQNKNSWNKSVPVFNPNTVVTAYDFNRVASLVGSSIQVNFKDPIRASDFESLKIAVNRDSL